MSMDPSAIPSFGAAPKKPEQPEEPQQSKQPQEGQQGQQGQQPRAVRVAVPDKALVTQVLERMNLKHQDDQQGDVVARWKEFRVYFMFRGEKQQRVMSVRTFYDRKYTLDDKPRLLESLDDWNRRTLWPKVYTHTTDEGTVRLIGEVQMLIGHGVVVDHFISSMVSWVNASIEFEKWLVEQLGLAKDTGGGGSGSGGGSPA
jgi:hypothetical protein